MTIDRMGRAQLLKFHRGRHYYGGARGVKS
jgi:hypothetical protein